MLHVLLAVVAMLMISGCVEARKPMRLDAERGTLEGGLEIRADRAGHSGAGYVSNFRTPDDRLRFTIEAPGGLYRAVIRYAADHPKGYVLDVNGSRYSGMFPATDGAFAYHEAGLLELQRGSNELALFGGWHYYDIDSIDLFPADTPPRPTIPPAIPADAFATPTTRALLAYLAGNYGQRTLSGVLVEDAEFVYEATGKRPAILAADFMDYSTSSLKFGAHGDGRTEKMIANARRGHLVSYCWHWRAPKDLINQMITREDGQTINAMWYKGFNTSATTFDVARALADRDSEDYQLLLQDIDLIAVELRKFADADIPVLWRPLHEADGKWFWWGAKGPEPFKELWRVMFDRLTHHHDLHNLIWVYTGTADMAWYPGDAYVDIIGVDAYPSDKRDPLAGIWADLQQHFDGRKLLALSEFGAVPDMARAYRFGVYWSYFVPWGGELGPKGMDRDTLIERMQNPQLIHLEDLPR